MRKLLTILIVFFLLMACRKPYSPPATETSNTVLIVEGMIAVGDSVKNRILLSRLQALEDTSVNNPESGARITIVSKSGRSWDIVETSLGTYEAVYDIPTDSEYKLLINTRAGKSYETPFMTPVNTPPIDSVTWLQPHDLNVYVHSHDPTAKTRYYRWDYTETWQYNAYYNPECEYINGAIVFNPPGYQFYSCWRTRESNTVEIQNTNALAEDRVSYFPIRTILNGEEEGSARYSILVKQYGLTKEAYEFWNILKKNTELTGSLFDPQPSQLPTNITCVNDPNERVVGFICAGKQTVKRMFVSYEDLNFDDTKWPVVKDHDLCKADSTGGTARMDAEPEYVPAFFYGSPGVLAIAKKICVDCRLQGGTNVKPVFW